MANSARNSLEIDPGSSWAIATPSCTSDAGCLGSPGSKDDFARSLLVRCRLEIMDDSGERAWEEAERCTEVESCSTGCCRGCFRSKEHLGKSQRVFGAPALGSSPGLVVGFEEIAPFDSMEILVKS